MFFKCSLVIIFILILIRVVLVLGLGEFYEGDEVVILFWGREWILNQEIHFITQSDLPSWETFSAYLFSSFDLTGISPRWGAFLVGILEVFFVFKWIQLLLNTRLALVGAIIMLTMPYHIFFSISVGPLNSGLFTALYLYVSSLPKALTRRYFISLCGLWYYASFRLLIAWSILKNIREKKIRNLFPEIFAFLSVVLFLFFFFEKDFTNFFKKGSYLLERGFSYFVMMYFQSVFIWFIPFFDSIFSFLQQYQFDDLGRAFRQVNNFDTPFTLPLSVLFIFGLFYSFRNSTFSNLRILLLVAFILIGWTSTLVHFVFLVPVFVFFMTQGYLYLSIRFSTSALNKVVAVGLSLVLVSNFIFLYRIFNPKPNYLIQDLIVKPVEKLRLHHVDLNEVLFVASNQGLYLRYIGTKNNWQWTFYYDDVDRWILETQLKISNKKFKYFLVYNPIDFDSKQPNIIESYKKNVYLHKKYEDVLGVNFFFKSVKDVVLDNGLKVARLYELDSKAR